MITAGETARLTGVSVRTLHYYDEIGLLHPAATTGAGYRLYNDESLSRLQQILFFRELDVPLEEIGRILNDPSFDTQGALKRHRTLLEMKRDRLNGLLHLVDNTLKGEYPMSFQEFDQSTIEAARAQYREEALDRWGNTDAFVESERRTRRYSKADWARIAEEEGRLYTEFCTCMQAHPANSPEATALARRWQNHITSHYYNCTDTILAGLAELYISDERFTKNIDKYGSGLAAYMSAAILASTTQA